VRCRPHRWCPTRPTGQLSGPARRGRGVLGGTGTGSGPVARSSNPMLLPRLQVPAPACLWECPSQIASLWECPSLVPAQLDKARQTLTQVGWPVPMFWKRLRRAKLPFWDHEGVGQSIVAPSPLSTMVRKTCLGGLPLSMCSHACAGMRHMLSFGMRLQSFTLSLAFGHTLCVLVLAVGGC